MNKKIIVTAAFFGVFAVIFGAFGAHSLKNLVAPSSLGTWATAVEYQFYHVFALLFLSTFARFRSKLVDWAYYCFTAGIILFSGSLYLLATRDVHHLSFVNHIGPVTPLGGLFFIAGWLFLLSAALKHK